MLFRPERVAVVGATPREGSRSAGPSLRPSDGPQLALDFPEVRELDVNPLLATPDGVTALDFRLAFDPGDG